MTEKTEIFNKLYAIDFKGKIEKKGQFNYISWASAWAELQKIYPEVVYEIVKFNELPYKQNQNGECIVFTKMTIEGVQHEMWLPVMDFKNQAHKNPSMMDINKTIMRCLVKNMAMFGLGLKVYEGEDLVEDEPQKQTPAEKKPEPQKQGNVSVSFETIKDYLLESPSKERLEAIWKRGESHIVKYTKEQQTEITNIYNNKLAKLCTK